MNVTGKMKGRLVAVVLLVILIAGIRYLASGDDAQTLPEARTWSFDSFTMGTLLSVKIRLQDKEEAKRMADIARDEIARLHRVFDPHDPESELSRLNASRGGSGPVQLSEDLSVVLAAALHTRDLSGGAFEPALGNVSRLWGFSEERRRNHPPDSAEIMARLDSTSLSREAELSADRRSVKLGARCGIIELGAIVKGYAADRAVEVLRQAGVRNALIDLGGEIGVLGVGSDGVSWRVGVQHPRRRDSHIGALSLHEGLSVATSGDYERFFVDNGRRYHHILDSRTGYPASSGVVGITVVTEKGLEADAMSTAAFILGPEKGLALLEQEKCEGLVIYVEDGRTEDGKLLWRATSGFSKYLPHPDLEGLPLP